MRHPLMALAALVIAAVAAAEDKPKKVESQVFTTWAKQKVGTSVVLKETVETKGKTQETIITTKLLEVADEKVVVESEWVIKADGKELQLPASSRDIQKFGEEKASRGDPKTGKPDGTTEEGKEKLKISGTEYECRWYKFSSKSPDGYDELEGQMWLNDDVPGRIVKVVLKAKAGTLRREVTDITIKK
jgi:hypothetical protein